MPEPAPITIDELARRLAPGQPLIGLDVGTKTIGIAMSDRSRRIATARETIRRTKFAADAARLLDIARADGAAAIVVGLPISMDGSEGPRAQSTRAFARNLARLTDLAIAFWDERLSSVAVERMLVAADRSRARRAELVDKLAAAYILQGALDRLARIAQSSIAE